MSDPHAQAALLNRKIEQIQTDLRYYRGAVERCLSQIRTLEAEILGLQGES